MELAIAVSSCCFRLLSGNEIPTDIVFGTSSGPVFFEGVDGGRKDSDPDVL